MSRATLAVLVLCALPGCTPEARARMAETARANKRDMAQRQLEERAGDYWNALRWKNWSLAASFLEDEEDQLAFLRLHAGDEAAAMEDVAVTYAFVNGEELESGEVRVRWNAFQATSGAVAPNEASQRWYKRRMLWWLDPESALLPVHAVAPGEVSAGLDQSPMSP